MKLVSLFNPVSLASDPESGNDGDLYYNTVEKNYRIKSNGRWISLTNEDNLKINIAPEIFSVGSPTTASTSVTLEQYYSENIISCLSASLTQIVIPEQSTTSIHTGSRIGIYRGGIGEVEIIAGSPGVNFDPPSDIYLTKTGSEVRLINIDYNTWILSGEFPDLY